MLSAAVFREAPHKCFRYAVRLTPETRRAGAVLLDRPGVCRCSVRAIGGDPAYRTFEENQNYRASGDGLALEAEIFLASSEHPDWKSLRIGVPLAEIPDAEDLDITYTGTRFTLSSGGKVLDEEFPFGDPPGEPEEAARIAPAPASPPAPVWRTGPLHLRSPDGIDAWAGDVTVGYFGGEFHLFFLHDRRHHASGFSTGKHTWHHLATRDLKTWRDDGEILPLQAQWQSYGTGTPFLRDGKILLTYGFHTERFFADGAAPRGGTWAESADGRHFTPSGMLFTRSTNPSVFNAPDGRLLLFEGDDRIITIRAAGPWPEFPHTLGTLPVGQAAATRHSAECPAYFFWHGRHFLLVGFSGMYSAAEPGFSDACDLAAEGLDVYDGLDVPMVAPFADDRRILAGWLRVGGWGGVPGLRELVWCADGVPGVRWLDEAMPVCGAWTAFAGETAVRGNAALELDMAPGRDLRVRLEGAGEAVEFRIHAAARKAELVFASVRDLPAETVFPTDRRPGGRAVKRLRGIGRPYRVRLMVWTERKLTGTIVDAEIAGLRTMIHYFAGHSVRSVRVSGADAARVAPVG